MENLIEEKSLVKVDNSIFARMRRFFHGLFSRRKNAENIEIDEQENVNEVKVEKEEIKREVYTEPKLFNYDNPQYRYDSTLGKKPILNNNGEQNNESQSQISFEDTGISRYFNNDNNVEENNEYDADIEHEKDASKYEEDGYEGKDELEQKLMNYYASIKKVLQ